MIKAFTKQPGQPLRSVNMSEKLENLQTYVGGYIEMIRIASDAVCIVNEEGKLLDLPFNFSLGGQDIVGPAIFAGVNADGDLCDMPIDFKTFKQMFTKEE